MSNETILEDWAIVAYLSLKDNFEITPFKKSDGRVAFRVHGDIESAISDIYANRKVPINDYLKALKSVRHAIFTLKGLKHENEKDEGYGKVKGKTE